MSFVYVTVEYPYIFLWPALSTRTEADIACLFRGSRWWPVVILWTLCPLQTTGQPLTSETPLFSPEDNLQEDLFAACWFYFCVLWRLCCICWIRTWEGLSLLASWFMKKWISNLVVKDLVGLPKACWEPAVLAVNLTGTCRTHFWSTTFSSGEVKSCFASCTDVKSSHMHTYLCKNNVSQKNWTNQTDKNAEKLTPWHTFKDELP